MNAGPATHRAALTTMLLCAMLLPARAADGQTATKLTDWNGVEGWKAEGATGSAEAGVLTVRAGRGWIRREQVLADFTLTMEVRLTGAAAKGGVYVRAWPTFDKESRPSNGLRVEILNSDPSPDGVSPWMRVEIRCDGRTLTVLVDGQESLSRQDLSNPQGFVALAVQDGTAEFRRIELTLPPARPVQPRDPGVVLPRPLKDVKPSYSAAAMRARISGTVLTEAVVREDGTVGEVIVTRSLDPHYGLDQAAVAAVKQWRFSPGRRGDTPVAVPVMIELTFTLK